MGKIGPDGAFGGESGAGLANPADRPSRTLRRERLDLGVDYVAPKGEVERRLAGLWHFVLAVDRIGSQDRFFDLGGDSLAATALFTAIEAEFGLRLAPSTIVDHPTLASLAALLADEAASSAGRCLVPLQREGADPPLFVIHELSGQLLAYRDLLKRLPGRQIHGLQYPDQDRDPVPILSLPEMASAYLGAIRTVQAHGPYFLLGYSLGGSIAYEIARQLRGRGEEVGLLAMIDTPTHGAKPLALQRVFRSLARHLTRLSEEAPSGWPRYLGGALKARAAWMKAQRERHKTPPLVLGDHLLRQHQAHRPGTYDGPIKLLRCTDGPSYWSRHDLGWGSWSSGRIEVLEIPADHLAILKEPMVALIAAYLEQWMKVPPPTLAKAPGEAEPCPAAAADPLPELGRRA